MVLGVVDNLVMLRVADCAKGDIREGREERGGMGAGQWRGQGGGGERAKLRACLGG